MRFKLFHDENINYLMIINDNEKTYLITSMGCIIKVFRSKKYDRTVRSITYDIAVDKIKMLNRLGYKRIYHFDE